MNPNPDQQRRNSDLHKELTELVEDVTMQPEGAEARYNRIRDILEVIENERTSHKLELP